MAKSKAAAKKTATKNTVLTDTSNLNKAVKPAKMKPPVKDLQGFDPKNRTVTLTAEGSDFHVSKETAEHFSQSFDDYETAVSYFDYMLSCSHN